LEVQVIKSSLISQYKEIVRDIPNKHLVFYIATVSIFTHYILTFLLLIFLVCYSFYKKEIFKEISRLKGFIWIAIFSALLIIVPLCYGRKISIVIGIGIIFVFIYMMYAQIIMTTEIYNKAIDIACYMSVLCFAVGATQKLIMGFKVRTYAGLLNPNYYGAIIEFVIIMCIYRIITNKAKRNRYLLIIAVNIMGLFLCDCQSAWIATTTGAVVILLLNERRRRAITFLGIAGAIVAIGVFAPGLLPRLNKIPETIQTRQSIWDTAIKGINNRPLFGQGAFTYLFSYKDNGGPDAYATYHAHSIYLDPLLSYGIVGVGVLLGYLSLFFTRVHKMLKSTDKDMKRIASLIFGIGAAVLVHGITDITILWVQTGMVVCLISSGVAIKPKSNKNLSKES